MAKINEAALYQPVKQYFTDRGYAVHGEVMNCDAVAMSAEGIVHVIELKTACNLTLLLQAVARMKLASYVSIAIPTPTRRQLPLWRELCTLCERVGIGLLTVTFIKNGAFVTEHVIAQLTDVKPNRKRKAALVKEVQSRHGDFIVGGTNKVKQMTAYRQLSLLCVAQLLHRGPSSPKELREALLNDKVGRLLQMNVYGWFERKRVGIYDVSEAGQTAAITYATILREMGVLEYNKNN